MTDSGAGQLREPPVAGVDRVDGTVVVRLAGELDLYNANDVREALSTAVADDPQRLVVDLSRVDFIDSTALGVLIEARSKLTNGRTLMLAAPGIETRRTLEVSGLARHFAIHDSVDDAVSA